MCITHNIWRLFAVASCALLGLAFTLPGRGPILAVGGIAILVALIVYTRRTVAKLGELLDSSRELQHVIDHMPGLIAHLDRDLKFRFANRTYTEWYGVDPQALLGMTAQEFHGEHAYADLAPRLHSALSGNAVIDERAIVIGGRTRHCQVQLIPQRNGQGEVTGLYAIQTDVTERRAAETALRESVSFLARTGAVAGVGGWELDIRTNVLTWSEETKRLHDVEPGYQPTVDAALRFYTPAALPIIQQRLEDCIARAEPFDVELELVTASGRSIWTRATGAAEFEAGEAVRVVGAFQDITRRKALERDLADSHELMRVTLDSIGDAVITTDTAGHVVWLNPVAETMTGWTKDEARSRPLADVFDVTSTENGRPILDPVTVCLEKGASVGLQSHTTLRSRNGREYGIEDSASPIRNAEGQILGAVLVFHDVSEQRRLSREMSHRATHDELTGLVNRREFEHRLSSLLEAAKLDASSHVLMYIDLDEFKVVNDTCGHAAGDQLLRQVSVLLQGCMRGRDTVARLGGDEFGVILEMCNIEHGREIAQKICDQMELYRFAHDGRRYRLGTSIGCVPVDLRWTSAAAALQAADSCCYAAKDAGRNRVHLWVESDNTLTARQGEMQWASRLEAAIEGNRFVLFAQQIEPIGGAVPGLHCEVLLRLREPDGSIVLPGSFLPAAGRFDLISRIDKWVLANLFAMLEAGAPSFERIDTIAVNISGQSIGDRAFHRDLLRMLREAGFPPQKLCFEITEAAAITNFGEAKSFIGAVRALGVRIALDDFGAGGSSFGYLRMLPVDYLKIDGTFISGLLDEPLNQAAVRSFCEVAKAAGVRTIAKFVERSEIRAALHGFGVDFVQGYLMHRPEPLAVLLPSRQPSPSKQPLTLVQGRRVGKSHSH